ncbi:hypothetical protein EVAR_17578_1 [Eumeta japonica]|uniref:Uncharacterized protein n=1 Tax=Eumeta variegata TaxID=151549 RepID=A0A4C1UBX9_EUMVA|nr:hypothetical protein EVAR_17578_1 [Eumeta japonica]
MSFNLPKRACRDFESPATPSESLRSPYLAPVLDFDFVSPLDFDPGLDPDPGSACDSTLMKLFQRDPHSYSESTARRWDGAVVVAVNWRQHKGRVRPLSLFYSDASADGVEERDRSFRALARTLGSGGTR